MNSSDAVVSYRLGVGRCALPGLVGLLGAALFLNVVLAVEGDPLPPGELGQLGSAALFAVVVLTLLQRRYGVTVTPDALVLVGERHRRIPWAHIQGLEVRRCLGVGQVVVRTVDGRRTVLRAPMSLLDPRFEAKVRVLVERWSAARQTPPARRGPGGRDRPALPGPLSPPPAAAGPPAPAPSRRPPPGA
ncbi:hypothetical protein ACIBBD_19785 [Streptomyces sp. NPDC051315]|uniref:hypothetical protein n=1 Tax=Streptomyces sp. NPDC051315 TaxID=3365650 RepID=UPI003792BCCD